MQHTSNGAILSHFSDDSPGANEFRRLYSKLKNLYGAAEMKNLLVTSSMMGEGKSTVSALLACTIARYRNTKTILVDCDLRRPRVHQLFGLPKDEGVADVLAGTRKLDTCFKRTAIENLRLLTSGGLVDNPTELFNSPRLRDLFSEIKFYFDTVIVDSPPIIPVTDTLILSPEMDGALMVIKAGVTHKEVVKRAVDMMRNAGFNILGTVINNQKSVLPYYFDYTYYGYKYYVHEEKK
ncbi:MAG: CpsD/CapB family tyrosine-protein kinase [candidate division KSB1 bacterium]|nr:CpsD/CapB family tyrosine-protein kinase [candidate division KSB1 bacterium]MDZ7302296.1 CpsD/CapB family tyrosine-protein kinase [candidate division KSB1 bacterium]MDZ7311402.1 CpsD/CapB family tyrosine-protein kinase [candidate division KSB1 bacterium]